MNEIVCNATLAGSMILSLAACDQSPMQEYSINISNVTHGQPLSPPVAMLHSKKTQLWKIGEQASEALEAMAEGGDGSGLLSTRPRNPQYQANAPLLPGESIEFTLEARTNKVKNLSIAGMLVNTNDAFSGLNCIELVNLKAGQSSVYYTYAYDAGTEFNSELNNTIPGPADNGEGFNAVRDDVTSVVTFHSGVVSSDDNFADSTLSGANKFDNPILRIEVTALEASTKK